MPNQTKILYIHGLESGPVGSKTIALGANPKFHVDAVDMHMSRYDLRKKHSVIRNLIRQQALPLFGCSVAAMAAFKGVYPQLLLPGIALYFGAAYYFKDKLLSNALQQSMEQCVDVQRGAINKYKPDLLIGSSWGGGVAMELLTRELWIGPTILLCPYYVGYRKYVHFKQSNMSLDEFYENVLELKLKNDKKHLIVHGSIDEVISIDDSKMIQEINPNSFDLKVIPNDNHRLSGLTTANNF